MDSKNCLDPKESTRGSGCNLNFESGREGTQNVRLIYPMAVPACNDASTLCFNASFDEIHTQDPIDVRLLFLPIRDAICERGLHGQHKDANIYF